MARSRAEWTSLLLSADTASRGTLVSGWSSNTRPEGHVVDPDQPSKTGTSRSVAGASANTEAWAPTRGGVYETEGQRFESSRRISDTPSVEGVSSFLGALNGADEAALSGNRTLSSSEQALLVPARRTRGAARRITLHVRRRPGRRGRLPRVAAAAPGHPATGDSAPERVARTCALLRTLVRAKLAEWHTRDDGDPGRWLARAGEYVATAGRYGAAP